MNKLSKNLIIISLCLLTGLLFCQPARAFQINNFDVNSRYEDVENFVAEESKKFWKTYLADMIFPNKFEIGFIAFILNTPIEGATIRRDENVDIEYFMVMLTCNNTPVDDAYNQAILMSKPKNMDSKAGTAWKEGRFYTDYNQGNETEIAGFSVAKSEIIQKFGKKIVNYNLKIPKDFPPGEARLFIYEIYTKGTTSAINGMTGYIDVNVIPSKAEEGPPPSSPLPSGPEPAPGPGPGPAVNLPQIEFWSNKSIVIKSSSISPQVELSWKVTNFDQCYITSSPENESLQEKNIDFKKDNKTTISIDKTTTFTLTCSKGSETTSSDLAVRVFTPFLQEVKP